MKLAKQLGTIAVLCAFLLGPRVGAQVTGFRDDKTSMSKIVRSTALVFSMDGSGNIAKPGRLLGYGFFMSVPTPQYMRQQFPRLKERSVLLITNRIPVQGLDAIMVRECVGGNVVPVQLYVSGPLKNLFVSGPGGHDLVAIGGWDDYFVDEPIIRYEQLLPKYEYEFDKELTSAGVREGREVFALDYNGTPDPNALVTEQLVARSGKLAQSARSTSVFSNGQGFQDVQDGYIVQLGTSNGAAGAPVFLSESPGELCSSTSPGDTTPVLIGVTKRFFTAPIGELSGMDSSPLSEKLRVPTGLVSIESAYYLRETIEQAWGIDPKRATVRPSLAQSGILQSHARQNEVCAWLLENPQDFDFSVSSSGTGNARTLVAYLKSKANYSKAGNLIPQYATTPVFDQRVSLAVNMKTALKPGSTVEIWITHTGHKFPRTSWAPPPNPDPNVKTDKVVVSGEHEWANYGVESSAVIEKGDSVSYGIRLLGAGEVWVNEVKISGIRGR